MCNIRCRLSRGNPLFCLLVCRIGGIIRIEWPTVNSYRITCLSIVKKLIVLVSEGTKNTVYRACKENQCTFLMGLSLFLSLLYQLILPSPSVAHLRLHCFKIKDFVFGKSHCQLKIILWKA